MKYYKKDLSIGTGITCSGDKHEIIYTITKIVADKCLVEWLSDYNVEYSETIEMSEILSHVNANHWVIVRPISIDRQEFIGKLNTYYNRLELKI